MLNSSLSAPSADLVIQVLCSVLCDNKPLDRAYSIAFSGLKLQPAEQGRITTVAGDIMRRLNLYCFLAGIEPSEVNRKGTLLLNVWHRFHGLTAPKFRYCEVLEESELQQRITQAKADLPLWDGCPAWLEQLGSAQLGEQWPAERAALRQMPHRYLRANLLKCQLDALMARLAKEGVQTIAVEGVETALQVESDSALFRTQSFKDGWFEQQDAGSQHVAAALDAKPGMRVIDACAGAGGKTLHLAAQMQGKGRLLAMDVESWKLDNLKDRARRAGAHNVETRLIASSKTIKRLKLSADRLLLDVPCSGLGVLKRNPDTKWRDTPERLTVLHELQAHIIDSYSRMLKVGGLMVYATCSIMPDENRAQVDKFLAAHPNFRLLDDETITPANSGFDGFYLARIERIAE
ncbi:SAM-dependent methyltransferase [Shewanella sp. NFH-SH190041]|uniref:RsmB/NOP family class I SAM-dependent RNA methyltransferase n=1 Tax=Shewanella sp. NFH-SH190041 TaxID=2950245 RepID=UPI0021C4A4D2|nr:RsmB/NOP family class I SAM-dependent RNA methyltransferase [Shewanella sp. NFH-SH190041]BDM64772.1 SAM-dependent methyltransferase [Shewanella sp. NFH-SH190041]